MPTYRKKPVAIEARELTDDADWDALAAWCGATPHAHTLGDTKDQIAIPTLEGVIWASVGDWIIRGVKGEFYPCKPDIFAETYEPAEPAPEPELTAEQQVRGVQAWMALDLHMALGFPVDHSADAHHQGHKTWADWWAFLLHHVRTARVLPKAPADPAPETDTIAALTRVSLTVAGWRQGDVADYEALEAIEAAVLAADVEPAPEPTEDPIPAHFQHDEDELSGLGDSGSIGFPGEFTTTPEGGA
jgi:hypothetical protein